MKTQGIFDRGSAPPWLRELGESICAAIVSAVESLESREGVEVTDGEILAVLLTMAAAHLKELPEPVRRVVIAHLDAQTRRSD